MPRGLKAGDSVDNIDDEVASPPPTFEEAILFGIFCVFSILNS